MDGHAMHNVLKRQQSLIDSTNPSTSSSLAFIVVPNHPSIYVDLKIPSHGPCVALAPWFTSIILEKSKMKVDYLQNQSQSIE
jgi:hypothetical protein